MAVDVQVREFFGSLIDPDRLSKLTDFQLGWFYRIFRHLCFEKDLRVRLDANLWMLAGARTKSFWETHGGLVVSCFKVKDENGEQWLCHSGLLSFIEGQKLAMEAVENKAHGHVCLESNDTLGELFINSYKYYPRHLQKRTAKKSFLSAVKRVSKEQKANLVDSAEFILQRVIQYAAACERARKEKKYIPYMSTWLNGDGFNDDPSEWVVQVSVNGNEKKSALQERLDGIDKMEF